jgi:hypothetical protein
MDEEKTHLWNKKMDELTVGDAMKLNGAVLAITVGGLFAFAGAVTVWEKSTSKFKQMKLDREAKKNQNEK